MFALIDQHSKLDSDSNQSLKQQFIGRHMLFHLKTLSGLGPNRVCRGRDRMVVGFITTCAISAYHRPRSEFEPRTW
jgi:hypothetical protein